MNLDGSPIYRVYRIDFEDVPEGSKLTARAEVTLTIGDFQIGLGGWGVLVRAGRVVAFPPGRRNGSGRWVDAVRMKESDRLRIEAAIREAWNHQPEKVGR